MVGKTDPGSFVNEYVLLLDKERYAALFLTYCSRMR